MLVNIRHFRKNCLQFSALLIVNKAAKNVNKTLCLLLGRALCEGGQCEGPLCEGPL